MKKTKQNSFILLLPLLSLFFAFGIEDIFAVEGLKISPVVGFERIYKIRPERKVKTRAVLGLNVRYGFPLLSFEAEGTRSDDSETLYIQGLEEKEKSYALRIGFRSSFNFSYLSWFLRAGGQARKSYYETTVANVTTESESALYISPYAGTGFSFNFMSNLFASGGITVVFSGRPKGSDREYQTTLSCGVRI